MQTRCQSQRARNQNGARSKRLNRMEMYDRRNQFIGVFVRFRNKLGNICRANRQELFDGIGGEAQEKGFVGALLFVAGKIEVIGLFLAIP